MSEIMCPAKRQNYTTREEATKSTILVERVLFMFDVCMFVVIVYLWDKAPKLKISPFIVPKC